MNDIRHILTRKTLPPGLPARNDTEDGRPDIS